jgi:hypothetical protein
MSMIIPQPLHHPVVVLALNASPWQGFSLVHLSSVICALLAGKQQL